MIYAILCHQYKVVKLLVDLGVDLHRKVNGMSPIHYATAVRNKKIVELLVYNDISLANEETGDGEAPLDFAVSVEDLDITIFLLAAGADVKHVNTDGNTALHLAMGCYSKEMIEALIAFGADLSISNFTDMKPIDLTMVIQNTDNYELVQRIISEEEDVPTKEEILNKYPQKIMIDDFKAKSNSGTLMKLLL